MRKFLILMILMISLLTLCVEKLKTPDPFFGMCPYANTGDLVLKNEKTIFTIDTSVENLGILTNAALTEDMFDAVERFYFSINWKPVRFQKFEATNESITFHGAAGDREVTLIYSLNEYSLNMKLSVSSEPEERVELRIHMKVCDMDPVIIKGKNLHFIQARNVAYGIYAEHSKAIFAAGSLMIISRKKADSDTTTFDVKLFVGRDVESIRKIVGKGIRRAVKKVVMENGEPARYIKIAVLGNGKVFTISTTDETGSMVFTVPGKNYSFSILTEGYKLVSSNSVLVVSCPSQNSFLWGPYITDPTTNSAYLNFKLSKPSTALIILTDENGNTQKLESRFLDTFHSIKLENLVPNEEYSVLVKVDGIEERCGFKTLGSRSFKFVIYGDTRTNEDWHEMVCKEIAKEKPLFVINVGDLVENGESLEDWNKFFKALKSLSAVSPYFPVLGNHEKNSNIYYQAFMLPKGGGDFQRRWYSFDAGDVRFIVLDSNVPEGTSLFEKQTKWLIEDLERNRDKKFKLVFFHHPFYTNTPNEEPTHEESWRWIFEKYKVDVVFSGHIHDYERFLKNGVIYMVTGGGGAPLGFGLYSPDRKHLPGSVKEAAGYLHYVLAEVQEDGIKFTVKSVGRYIKVGKVKVIVPWKMILDEFYVK